MRHVSGVEWITEEDMYPYSRVNENYEDTEELTMFDFWEDYYQESKYERQDI